MDLTPILAADPDLIALADAGDADGLLAALNAKTVAKANPAKQNLLSYAAAYPAAPTIRYELRAIVEGLLSAPDEAVPAPLKADVEDFWLNFRTGGADLSAETIQTQLVAVRDGLPEQQRAPVEALIGLGRWTESVVESAFGRGIKVEADDVADALSAWAARRVREQVAQRLELARQANDRGEFASVADAAAYVVGEG